MYTCDYGNSVMVSVSSNHLKDFWIRQTHDTQQDYYGLEHSNLLHSYLTGTYTKVVVLLFWSISVVTM